MTAIDCDGDVFVTETFETLSEAVAAVAEFASNEYRHGADDIAITVLTK